MKMKKSSKIIIGIFTPLAIACLVLSKMIAAKVPEQYPQSTLVYSVFTAENNRYVPSESLPNIYEFQSIPYTIDVPNADSAHIGNGTIYQINPSEGKFLYITELDASQPLNEVVMKEFPKAVIYSYNENSTISDIITDAGYVNGFSAEYNVKGLYITDSANESNIVMVGYRINFPTYGKDIFVGTTTNILTTEEMASAKGFSDSMIRTIRINEDLAKDIEITPIQTEIDENPISENTSGYTFTKDIEISEHVETTIIYCSWDIATTDINVVAIDENGNEITPNEITEYEAMFQLNDVGPTSYSIIINSAENLNIQYIKDGEVLSDETVQESTVSENNAENNSEKTSEEGTEEGTETHEED